MTMFDRDDIVTKKIKSGISETRCIRNGLWKKITV